MNIPGFVAERCTRYTPENKVLGSYTKIEIYGSDTLSDVRPLFDSCVSGDGLHFCSCGTKRCSCYCSYDDCFCT